MLEWIDGPVSWLLSFDMFTSQETWFFDLYTSTTRRAPLQQIEVTVVSHEHRCRPGAPTIPAPARVTWRTSRDTTGTSVC